MRCSAINPFRHQKDAKDKAQLYLTLDKNSREHYSHYAKGNTVHTQCVANSPRR